MRTTNLVSALLLGLASVFTMTSCSNDPSNSSNDNTQTVISNNVQAGGWRITYYNDSGKDETSHFTGYTFSFETNGTLTATNGSTTYTGSWSMTDSNSNDDTINDLHFNIHFNLTNDFEGLNEDWNFISQSSTKIELTHVSGGNGGTDFLTFEMN